MFDNLVLRLYLLKQAKGENNQEWPIEKVINAPDQYLFGGIGLSYLASRLQKPVMSLKEMLSTVQIPEAEVQEFLKQKPSLMERLFGKGETYAEYSKPQVVMAKLVERTHPTHVGFKPTSHVTKIHEFTQKPFVRGLRTVGAPLGMGGMLLGTFTGNEPLTYGSLLGWSALELPQAYVEAAKAFKASKAMYRAAGGGLKGIKATLPFAGKLIALPWWGLWALGGGIGLVRSLIQKKKPKETEAPVTELPQSARPPLPTNV